MNSYPIEIDRSSPVPVYHQVSTDIKNRIIRKEWEINERLPSEIALAKHYNISRVTLRQALAELEKDGIIAKQRGRGTFIRLDPTPFVTKLNYSLVSSSRQEHGMPGVEADILDKRLVFNLLPMVYENLRLPSGSPVLYIKRLFFFNGNPIAIVNSYIPAHLVPGMENSALEDNSLSYTLKHRYHIVAERVDDYIEAVRATQAECSLLGCSLDTPLISVEGVSYLPGDVPLEYSYTLWQGDCVRFHFPLQLG